MVPSLSSAYTAHHHYPCRRTSTFVGAQYKIQISGPVVGSIGVGEGRFRARTKLERLQFLLRCTLLSRYPFSYDVKLLEMNGIVELFTSKQ